MAEFQTQKRFLEPVYLNESMVLNAAAYLFSGYEDSVTQSAGGSTSSAIEANAGGAVPFGFLNLMFGVKGEDRRATDSQSESLRKFTVGGLHMQLVDRIHDEDMVTEFESVDDSLIDASRERDGYFHAHAVLRPTDYWSALQILRTNLPLITDLMDEYAGSIIDATPHMDRAAEEFVSNFGRHSKAVHSTVDRLVDDYFKSGMVEMMMWIDGTKQLGVVDLMTGDRDPQSLLASLTGGRYHVYGKISARAKSSEKLSLLQRTTFFQIQEFYYRLIRSIANRKKVPGESDIELMESEGVDDLLEVLQGFKMVGKVLQLEQPGPAVRVLGMSVSL